MHPASEPRTWAASFSQDLKPSSGDWRLDSMQEPWQAHASHSQRQPSAGPSSSPLPRHDSVSSDLGLRAPELLVKFEHHAIDYVRTAACSLSGYSSQQSASTYMEQDVLPAHYLYGQIQDGLDSDIEDMMQLQDLQPSSSSASQGSSHQEPHWAPPQHAPPPQPQPQPVWHPTQPQPHTTQPQPQSQPEPQPVWQSEERRRRPRSRNAPLANSHLRCSLLATFNALAAQERARRRSQRPRRAASCPQQALLRMLPHQGPGGSCTLQQWVSRHGPLTQGQACAVLGQAVGQLRRLHARGGAHGAVGLQSLLLGEDEDFGCARLSAPQEGASSSSSSCDLIYTAPELLGLPAGKTISTASGDMWALGICAFMLLSSNRAPFSAVQLADQAIGSLPDSVQIWIDHHLAGALRQQHQAFPHWAQSVLKGLLKADPAQRLTASKLAQICHARQEAQAPTPEQPNWQYNLSYEEGRPQQGPQLDRWRSNSEEQLRQTVSTLSHLALHAPRPCSAEAKSATLQDPSELQGAHTSGRRQSYPGAAAHMAGGSSEYHPIIYSSSTENPAPQGPGQNLIGWLQRLVTRSARSTPTAEARPSQPFPHPEWI